MGALSNHKIKIISSLAGASVISAGVTIHCLTNNVSDEPKIDNPEQAYPLVENKATPVKQMSKPDEKPKENTASKLASLKNEKVQLLNNVEGQISSYKNMITKINDVKRLEDELNKCFSKGEVSTNITDNEKQQLKSNYEAVRSDITKYEEIQKQIQQGDLKNKESYADGDNTNEERYNDFKTKFDEINQEYKDTVNKKSGENLSTSFKNIKSKLTVTNQQCSFKDLIKINDLSASKS